MQTLNVKLFIFEHTVNNLETTKKINLLCISYYLNLGCLHAFVSVDSSLQKNAGNFPIC